MSFPVVQATIHDLDVLTGLFDAYRQFYDQPGDLVRARNFLLERLQLRESQILLARGGDGAGLGFAQMYPLFSSVRAVRTWLLNDLFVAPQARRQGVGAALLHAAAERGRELGVTSLMLWTGIDNSTAQTLYESMGWQRESSCEYLLAL